VDGSVNYQENNPFPNDTILTPQQIDMATAAHGNNIIVHSRSYLGAANLSGTLSDDHRGYFVNMALSNPNTAGVVFEAAANQDLSAIHLNEGIGAVLASGKRCYVLLPPRQGSTNYCGDIQAALGYLAQSATIHVEGYLTNPNLYLVLAAYDRDSTGVSFLDPTNPTSTTNPNTIAGALRCANNYRDTH
jgi:hypothetical protein